MHQWILFLALLVSQFVTATNFSLVYDFLPDSVVEMASQGQYQEPQSQYQEPELADGEDAADALNTQVDLCLPPMAVGSQPGCPVLRHSPLVAFSFSVVSFIPPIKTPPPIAVVS